MRHDPARRVLLLDRGPRPAQGNTRRSVALYRDLFTSSQNRDLASSTIALFGHIEDELGYNLGLERFGYLWMMGPARLRSLRGTLADMEARGSRFEVIDRSEVVARLGGALVPRPPSPDGDGKLEEVEGAVFLRNAGTLSPTRLARWFEERFRALGGEVEYGFSVDRLVPESAGGGSLRVWEEGRVGAVEGPAGRRRSKEFVVAAGVWTPKLLDPLGIDSHMKVQTRQAFGLVGEGATALHEANGFPGGDLPVLVLPAAGVYLKPIRSQQMLLAGCADSFGRGYGLEEDPQPEEAFLRDQVRPVLEAYLPSLKGAEERVSWAGQYHYSTLDGNPFLFKRSNVTVVAGASGSGIMKSDAIGRVAAAVHGEEASAELFDGRRIDVNTLGVRQRRVEPEALII
jgi:glycine/D-amino acid oxidase-like deaminating enzyme